MADDLAGVDQGRDGQDAKAANATLRTFSDTFDVVMKGYRSAEPIVKLGAAHTLLTAGLVGLTAALSLEILSALAAALGMKLQFTSWDLAILVLGSVVLLAFGSALRILDRRMIDEAGQREARRVAQATEASAEMADRVAALMSGAADRDLRTLAEATEASANRLERIAERMMQAIPKPPKEEPGPRKDL